MRKHVTIHILILFAAILLSGFIGYSIPRAEITTEADDPSSRRLNLNAEISESVYLSPLLTGYQNDVPFDPPENPEIENITLSIDSVTLTLEQAVQEEKITLEELIAYARIDAANGVCTEVSDTKNGLTGFTYQYPEYNLYLVYDIYETPDGKQHLIKNVYLDPPGDYHKVNTSYFDWDSEYGYQLDREDWGITLEVVEATPTEITLRCTHEGGQHFGELKSTQYTLFTADWAAVLSPEGFAGGICEDITIQQNTESTFTVSWEESHGELPGGEYYFKLWFTDVYDEADLHLLTRNYRNNQPYIIPFTIP